MVLTHLISNLFSRQRYSITCQRLEGRPFCTILFLIGNDEVDGIHVGREGCCMRCTLHAGYLYVFIAYRITIIPLIFICDGYGGWSFIGCRELYLAVWRSREADDRPLVNLNVFLICRCVCVVKLAIHSIWQVILVTHQVDLQVNFLLLIVFYLCNQDAIYPLIENIRCTILLGKMPGGCSFVFDIEDIEFVCFEYRIEYEVLGSCRIGISDLIPSLCCLLGIRTDFRFPIVQGMSFVIERLVFGDGEVITFFYPCRLWG